MAPWAVLLSGEHPSLPQAELESVLAAQGAPAPSIDGPAGIVPVGAGVPQALARLALSHAWGRHWGAASADVHGVEALCHAVVAHAAPGTVAVEAVRRGGERAVGTQELVRRLGAAAAAAGCTVDLARPATRIFAWLGQGRIHVGALEGRTDRSRYEARASERRAHFSPVALHPRRAASLVHLARVPQGGVILDPFCGTGTIVMEAALDGYRAIGSDLDPLMVQGTFQTLTDAGPEPVDGEVFQCDVGDLPAALGQVDGVVTDLPYGRASGTRGEDVARLYQRALASFALLLAPGGRVVAGCADATLLAGAGRHGFAVEQVHEEFVHRSLTRHYVILKRVQQVESHP